MQAILLGLGGVLLGVGSFLRLLNSEYHSTNGQVYQSWATSWAYGSDPGAVTESSSLLGVVFVLAVLLAVGAAVVLTTGRGDKPRARALVSLATGAVLGTALGVVVNVGLAPLTQSYGETDYGYGAAFWLCVVTVPLALAAVAAGPSATGTGFDVTVDSYGRPQRERPAGLDVTTAVLLILYAVVIVVVLVAEFVIESGEGMHFVVDDENSSMVVMALSALAAFVGALVLLLAKRPFARRAGATAAAFVFTVGACAVMPRIDVLRDWRGGLNYFGIDFLVQVIATLLVLVAMVLTVLAAGSPPRYRTSYPAAPPANPYAPMGGAQYQGVGVPQQGAPFPANPHFPMGGVPGAPHGYPPQAAPFPGAQPTSTPPTPMGGFPAPAVPQGYAPGFPQQGAGMPHTQPPGGFGGVPGEFAPGVDGQGGFSHGGTHQARYAPSLQKPGQISPPKQGTH